MRQVALIFRFLCVAFVFSFSGAVSAVFAQDADNNQFPAWQIAITGQIEAFRRGDAEAALSFAGSGFQMQYADPLRFYSDIKRSGYGPILDSRSHSFGGFEWVGNGAVAQVVLLQGPDQGLYQALYSLAAEPDGWRVQGVVLRKREGVGV